jgi:hypothetical protein
VHAELLFELEDGPAFALEAAGETDAEAFEVGVVLDLAVGGLASWGKLSERGQ